MDPSIKIQDDYWTGSKCLEYEMPWIVPGAVHKLATLVRPTDSVLDIGSGGSTLFYAARCAKVLAIETNKDWYEKVSAIIEAKNIRNVLYIHVPTQEGIEHFLHHIGVYDVVSIDSVHGYSRSRFLDIVAPRCAGTLVLDNYAEPVLFDKHYDWDAKQLASLLPGSNWFCEDFDDPHWCGKGTRLLYIP